MKIKLSTEELVEIWREDSAGEYVQVSESENAVAYVAHGRAMEYLRAEPGHPWPAIQAWMGQHKFWPNVWSVNERGNVTLRGEQGEDLGGLV